jgi:hypothetical protein
MHRVRLVVPALFALSISCGDTTAPARRTSDLAAARRRWQAQNLHTYAFTLQRSCFCVNTHRLYVAVLSDSVAEVLDLDTGMMLDRQLGETVEGLFSFIQSAIDRPAYRIETTYDAAKGFPSMIVYDGSAQIADDEITYLASDVHPITPQVAR